MASRVRRRFRGSADDSRGVSRARQRGAAALDTLGRPAEEPRCDLRAGRPRARLRGRRCADRAVQSLRRGRREHQGSAEIVVDTLAGVGRFELLMETLSYKIDG